MQGGRNRFWVQLKLLLCLALCGMLTSCTAPAPDGITRVTLWHGVNPPPNRDVLQTLVDQFNQTHADIEVEALYIGQGDQQIPKILAAVVGNAPPDLLWYAPMITGQLVELGAIRSLDDWYTEERLALLDPALERAIAFEDHYWSVPFGVNNVGVFYRPSLFEAAGITELPQTWDEFRQVAQQLTDPTADPPRQGLLLPLGKGEWTVFMWLPFCWSADGELQMDGKLNLVSEGAIAALDFWQTLVSDGSAKLSQPERGYELSDFLAGKVAMQLTGPWTLQELQSTGVDFAVMPIPSAQHPSTAIGGENLFVFQTTPDQEAAALELTDFLLSETAQTQWAIGTGYLPVNLRSRQSQDYQTFVDEQPTLKVFLKQAEYGRSRPLFPNYNRVSDQLGRAIEAVLLQKRSPAEALTQAQRRLEQMLGKNQVIHVLE
jgi:multiple sugar transport system substrate-binding protein